MNSPADTPAGPHENLLSGIRVIEVATFIFGPAAATVMADYGAEVIKIEKPGIGDPYRYLYQLPPMPECEENYCFILDGRNKRSVALDLGQPAGHAALVDLVRGADVLITNLQPSVVEKLHITYDELRAQNPRLIYAHATGYGDRGEDAEQPGYDMSAYWARSGLMDSVHSGDAEPALSVAGMGDHPSAMTLFGGIMLALYRRERTGAGSLVSSSLMANGAWANACLLQSVLCGAPPYVKTTRSAAYNVLVNHYLTRDRKRFLLCSLSTDKHWPALCRCVQRPEWLSDPRFATPETRRQHAAQLVAMLDEIFAERDYEHWRHALTEQQLVWSPVPTLHDVTHMPQFDAAGVFAPLTAPGVRAQRVVASPFSIGGVAKEAPAAAPRVGEHTRAVLESLGYSAGQIEALLTSGAAVQG